MEANKIYCKADDKYLQGVVLYGHSDNILYKDKAHKVKVKKADLTPYLNAPLFVEKDGSQYRPVSIKVSSDIEVVIITNSSATASAATLKTSEK